MDYLYTTNIRRNIHLRKRAEANVVGVKQESIKKGDGPISISTFEECINKNSK